MSEEMCKSYMIVFYNGLYNYVIMLVGFQFQIIMKGSWVFFWKYYTIIHFIILSDRGSYDLHKEWAIVSKHYYPKHNSDYQTAIQDSYISSGFNSFSAFFTMLGMSGRTIMTNFVQC